MVHLGQKKQLYGVNLTYQSGYTLIGAMYRNLKDYINDQDAGNHHWRLCTRVTTGKSQSFKLYQYQIATWSLEVYVAKSLLKPSLKLTVNMVYTTAMENIPDFDLPEIKNGLRIHRKPLESCESCQG